MTAPTQAERWTPGPWDVEVMPMAIEIIAPGNRILLQGSQGAAAYSYTVCAIDRAGETQQANANLIAAAPTMHGNIKATALFLDALANRLDGWARESQSGGWSTHQVSANRSAADDCRRMAAEARAALSAARGEGK